jgi:hypothetical protein
VAGTAIFRFVGRKRPSTDAIDKRSFSATGEAVAYKLGNTETHGSLWQEKSYDSRLSVLSGEAERQHIKVEVRQYFHHSRDT